MIWLWIALGIVLIVAPLVVVLGALLPREHSATVAREYRATPDRIWSLLTAPDEFPGWRGDVRSVEIRERDDDGTPLAWTETTRFGPLPFRVVERDPPTRLVGRIDSDDLPFAGTWTYRIEDFGEGRSRLTITEDGEVKNVVFRFLARYVFGYDRTMRSYHDCVGKVLAGENEPPTG